MEENPFVARWSRDWVAGGGRRVMLETLGPAPLTGDQHD